MKKNIDDKIIRNLFGDDYMDNFKVVHKLSDIPMKLLSHLWGHEAERYFNNYMKHGKLFWANTDGGQFLIHLSKDGMIMISNEKDHLVKPEHFEFQSGLQYVGLKLEDFLEFLTKEDNKKENVVKLTESDLVRLVKRVIKEHEEGDDIVIHYRDMDCDVYMKGILKEKFSKMKREYVLLFTPVENGFNSSCDKGGYSNSTGESFIHKMKTAYNENIGKDLVFINHSGEGWRTGSTKLGDVMEVFIQKIIPIPLEVIIKRY